MGLFNWSLFFEIFSAFSSKLKEAAADRVITVDEAIIIFKEVVDKLGFGKEPLIKF